MPRLNAILPFPPLTPAVFLERINRFVARCALADGLVAVHLPATGRLRELLVPGVVVWLAAMPSPRRVCHWDLTLVRYEDRLVCVDTRVPSRLARVALQSGALAGLPAGVVRPEVQLGDSRLDFRLASDPPTWVEVKSVTLVEDGVAVFPDAPTLRGARHLEELALAAARGDNAAALFLIQRPDARALRANTASDPAFAATLARVAQQGVRPIAVTCTVETTGISLLREVPVLV